MYCAVAVAHLLSTLSHTYTHVNKYTGNCVSKQFGKPHTQMNNFPHFGTMFSTLFSNSIFNYRLFNTFPHIDAFRRLFKNIVTKEEIAQNVQFLLLAQCFPLFVTGYPFSYGNCLCFDKIRSKSSAAELLYVGKG